MPKEIEYQVTIKIERTDGKGNPVANVLERTIWVTPEEESIEGALEIASNIFRTIIHN